MATWLIGGVILLYAVRVLQKRIREIREGRYCSYGCENCPAGCRKEESAHGEQ